MINGTLYEAAREKLMMNPKPNWIPANQIDSWKPSLRRGDTIRIDYSGPFHRITRDKPYDLRILGEYDIANDYYLLESIQ